MFAALAAGAVDKSALTNKAKEQTSKDQTNESERSFSVQFSFLKYNF